MVQNLHNISVSEPVRRSYHDHHIESILFVDQEQKQVRIKGNVAITKTVSTEQLFNDEAPPLALLVSLLPM